MDIINTNGKMSPEEFAARRKKELAILKASNQMLEDAKNNLIAMSEDDIDIHKYAGTQELSKQDKIKAIEEAQKENIAAGQSYYGASPEEIDKATYGEPDKASIRAYENRLKMRGITDEEMRRKSIDGAIVEVAESEKSKPKRRLGRRKKEKKEEATKTVSQTQVEKKKTTVDEVVSEQIVEEKKFETSKEVSSKMEIIQDAKPYIGGDGFKLSDIPDYVQYDIIPLPSNGECYPHKKDRIPVAYLTASDENIIASPNMYRDGKIIDAILSRKILDKTIDPSTLCEGDRDAVILWLRATGYGADFPVSFTSATDENKTIKTKVDLSKLKYKDFNLKGDENGLFSFYDSKGNELKFRFFTKGDKDKLSKDFEKRANILDVTEIGKCTEILRECFNRDTSLEGDDKEDVKDAIDILNEWANTYEIDESIEKLGYNTYITEMMKLHTVSINGNTDREYISNFIDNMRSLDAYSYRNYITTNTPGVDFRIKINIPESDGGGSFETFLRLDDFVFTNV